MVTNLLVSVLLLFPLQPSLDDQCANTEYAKLHPTICGEAANGFGVGGAGSGGSGGLGGIPIVGGILKGLGL